MAICLRQECQTCFRDEGVCANDFSATHQITPVNKRQRLARAQEGDVQTPDKVVIVIDSDCEEEPATQPQLNTSSCNNMAQVASSTLDDYVEDSIM